MDPNQTPTPVSTPPQPVVPQPPVVQPVSPTPDKPKSPNVLIILFLLLIIVVGGFFGYQKFVGGKAPKPTPTPQPTPITTPDPTIGWKTYTNTKYNYEIKFPKEFTAGINGMGGTPTETTSYLDIYDSTIKEPANYLNIAITVTPKGNTTAEAKAQAHLKKITTYVIKSNPTTEKELGYIAQSDKVIVDLTKTTFQGTDAYRYSVEGSYVVDGASEGIVAPKEHQYIWLEHGNNIYQISVKNVEKTSLLPNQILFTFKFFQTLPSPSSSPQPIPPTGWKTNTFTAQNLTIYTPTDWQSSSQDFASTSSTLIKFWKKASPEIVPIQLDIKPNWDNTGNAQSQVKNYKVAGSIDAYRVDPPKKTEATQERYQTNVYFEYQKKVYVFECVHNWDEDYIETCNKMLETLSFSY